LYHASASETPCDGGSLQQRAQLRPVDSRGLPTANCCVPGKSWTLGAIASRRRRN